MSIETNVTIYNKDCLEAKDLLEDNSIDLFFCDPPYFTTNIDWDKQWKSKEEYFTWCKEWISLMFVKLKATGSAYVCCDWRFSGQYQTMLEEAGFSIKNRVTWKRDKGRGAKTNWKNMHEDIWFVTKSENYTFNIEDVKIEKKVIATYRDENGNPKDWWVNENGEKVRLTYPGNLWEEFCVPFWSSKEVRSYAKTKKSPNNIHTKHNTQKPKKLVKKCILASSNKGETVVDFFGGSGTTAIASKELSRNCIIFEKNKDYCDITNIRIESEEDS